MTPERGPLPPLLPCPFCGAAAMRSHGTYAAHVHCSNEDCDAEVYARFKDSDAATQWNRRVATAEVARLAGQAVAWQVRSNLRDGMPSEAWSAWVNVSCDEYEFQRERGLSFIETRALGVIATPSAPIHWYCRKCGWVGIPNNSTT